jgi:hypothetical protein
MLIVAHTAEHLARAVPAVVGAGRAHGGLPDPQRSRT